MPVRAAPAPPFLSAAWLRAARTHIMAHEAELHKALGDVRVAALLIIDARPGREAEAVYVHVAAGHLSRLEWGGRARLEVEHPARDLSVTATYDTYARIHQGTLSELAAVLSGRARVHGSMAKALALIKTVVHVNRFLRQVPAGYASLPTADEATLEQDGRQRPRQERHEAEEEADP